MLKYRIPRKSGIVFFNGFSSNNNDFEPLMPYFKKCKNTLIISLPGDSNNVLNRDFIKYDEWITLHAEAIRELAKKVKHLFIIGYSVGAVPASYFADKFNPEKLILISPVFSYQKFDDAATSMVRMARNTVIGRGKTDPLNSIKSFKYIGTFFKNPIKNFGYLFKVKVGPLMNPSNILLFPIVELFEDELSAIDNAGGKVVNMIANRKYQEYDFGDDDVLFADSKKEKLVEMVKDDKTKTKSSAFFDSMFKNVVKMLPPEYQNLSSESVYNVMKLLAYCDKYTTTIHSLCLIMSGYDDNTKARNDLSKLLSKIDKGKTKMLSYPTQDHELFASEYYYDVTIDIIKFICETDSKPLEL